MSLLKTLVVATAATFISITGALAPWRNKLTARPPTLTA